MAGQLDWSSAIELNRASDESLSGQLASALQQKISSGVLPSGSRLPTTRELALALGVNRGTVQAAYRILQEAGLAKGRVGSGTEVSASPTPPPQFDPEDLLSRTFTDPGDSVAMESPTYSGALALARFAGVRIVEMPLGAEGADPAPLLGARPKLVYLMPERQNPTGVTAGDERRDEIVRAVAASGALLVEDGYEEPESGISPLAVRIPEPTVWLGTLSKDLVPGFRIGWIAGARGIVETLARVKKTADFQTPLPLQAAVAAFLREGADRRARRARAFDVEAKRITAARILKHLLPEVSWLGGEIGNPLFWISLPRGVSGRRVAEAAAARGVGVAPGCDFDPRGEDRANVRLSVSRVDKRDVEKGIRLFAEAVRAVTGSSGVHAMPVV